MRMVASSFRPLPVFPDLWGGGGSLGFEHSASSLPPFPAVQNKKNKKIKK